MEKYDKNYISQCHQAPVYLGSSGEGTNWYVCDECSEPCNYTRVYKGVPDPDKEPEDFNNYLINYNYVVKQGKFWILIKNSYIENQLVLFSLQTHKYISGLELTELVEMQSILSKYNGCHIYINADKDKSVPNRLHLHIKL